MARFALNHMSAPRQGIEGFFDLARRVGVDAVEIRNDLPGAALADGTPAEAVRRAAAARSLEIVSVNALQRFNDWTPERAEAAGALAAQARAAGARALVLCPVNEAGWRADRGERHAALVAALRGLSPILARAGLAGLIEPLGFAECSLRLKGEAVRAIREAGEAGRFALVHDTFHHALAGEGALFPADTALVHVSGVEDASVPLEGLRDGHRGLVGPRDRLDTVGQLRALLAGGFAGAVSFEPFSEAVAGDPDVAAALRASMNHVSGALQARAA